MRSILLLPILATAASLPAQWAQQSPPVSPSPRRAGAAAFDPISNRVYIYGGLTASPSQSINEMWAYNGQWTSLNPVGASPRWGHQMVADTANNRLITFGGRSPTINSLANDTLQWTGSSWTPIATVNKPSPRFLYGMAYDSARNRVVLFGGRAGFAPNNQTWEFDGTNWTQITTSNAPAAREEMGMVYDASLNRVVLFGGCDESTQTIFGDTWWYDGNDWTNVSPLNSPTPRFRGSMVYDSTRSRVVYYGGYDGTTILEQTLEYTGGEWLVIPPAGSNPTNATEAYGAYNPVQQKFVLFGGFGGSFSNATWQYTGNTDGVFSLYGVACDIASGTPGLTGSTPNIGTTLTVNATNLGTALGVIWAIGLSDQVFNGLPLPLDLGIVGLAGCNLVASPDFLDIALATSGSASYSLPIPNQTALVGQSVYCQALPIDLVPGLQFLGATRGGRALIGQ
ncbi:MAG: hypothetical protein KAI24_17000 [Planctomycetes bacterium]|nr:hypothetical protein [Planctomycetota bacterium]